MRATLLHGGRHISQPAGARATGVIETLHRTAPCTPPGLRRCERRVRASPGEIIHPIRSPTWRSLIGLRGCVHRTDRGAGLGLGSDAMSVRLGALFGRLLALHWLGLVNVAHCFFHHRIHRALRRCLGVTRLLFGLVAFRLCSHGPVLPKHARNKRRAADAVGVLGTMTSHNEAAPP
jgi:hypothetical protein